MISQMKKHGQVKRTKQWLTMQTVRTVYKYTGVQSQKGRTCVLYKKQIRPFDFSIHRTLSII